MGDREGRELRLKGENCHAQTQAVTTCGWWASFSLMQHVSWLIMCHAMMSQLAHEHCTGVW